MAQPKKKYDKNSVEGLILPSVWCPIFQSGSEWPDKDEFLDVIYWGRQIIGIFFGIIWGVISIKGAVGIILFCAINAALIYVYFNNYQKVDKEEFGGALEITKEGFMTSFASFLVTWIIFYSALHFS